MGELAVDELYIVVSGDPDPPSAVAGSEEMFSFVPGDRVRIAISKQRAEPNKGSNPLRSFPTTTMLSSALTISQHCCRFSRFEIPLL